MIRTFIYLLPVAFVTVGASDGHRRQAVQPTAQVKTLTADLADAKAKRDKWKKRAQAPQNEVAELRQARKRTETAEMATTLPVSASDGTSAEPSSTATAPPLPDESWTLAALRDEARRRGVTG